MCFRPPDVSSGPLICPSCGKKIVSPNFVPVTCPFCKAPLDQPDAATPPSAPTPMGGPAAPAAPSAPSAPAAAPQAPSAPKA